MYVILLRIFLFSFGFRQLCSIFLIFLTPHCTNLGTSSQRESMLQHDNTTTHTL